MRAGASAPALCCSDSLGATAELDLPALAHDTLRRLAAETGETINLAVAGPFGVEQIAQEDSRHFLGGTNWVGRRVPYHAARTARCCSLSVRAYLPTESSSA